MDRDILVISDLHIGDGGSRDNFGHKGSDRPKQLTAFLNYVEKEDAELIIAGDLLEFWQSNLSKVIVSNQAMLDRLAQLNATYILGNHDSDLSNFIGTDWLTHPLFKNMSGPITREIGSRTFKFMHGHETDPFNAGDTPSWGRMLAIFAGIFEERNSSPMLPSGESVEETLACFGKNLLRFWNWLVKRLKPAVSGGNSPSPKEELTPAQNPDRAAEMLVKYAANRSSEGYDVAIVGHTHQPGRMDGWYFNTGSWATTDNNFVQISPAGNVKVFDWNNGNPKENTTVLTLP